MAMLAPTAQPPVRSTADAARLAQRATAWFAEHSVDFGVFDAGTLVQRPIPFDPLPRRLSRAQWEELARELTQRVAVGRDYGDAGPVRGTFMSSAPGLAPEVSVITRRGAQGGPEMDQ